MFDLIKSKVSSYNINSVYGESAIPEFSSEQNFMQSVNDVK